MSKKLEGQVAVVTGASKGIGAAIAEHLAEAGAAVLAELASPDHAGELEEAEYCDYLVHRALRLMQAEFRPATWRACWEHAVNGRSAEDIAHELGMSVNAVYVARSRVLRRLREYLERLLD